MNEPDTLNLMLKKAKEYDERTNQPNCELEEKIEFLRKMADMVGVNMEEVFGKQHWWWDTTIDNDGGVVNDLKIREFYSSCYFLIYLYS